ncbi:MAG: GNAT family N-acetyltransferase [Bacilli bacterium]|nr:GNAT family N-acetyltransferase [Bacilli bacterium]
MLEYKLIRAKEKDSDILNSIKLVTMIDNEMDKALSYTEKEKIKKNVAKNIEINCEEYRLIHVGNKIAGAYLTLPYEDGVMIDEIYLFPEYRNQGIGTSIINRIIKSNENVYLWVYKNNTAALRLFERIGFVTMSSGRTMIMKYDKVYVNIKDKLEGIRLGYRDKEDNKYSGFDNDFKETFYLQSPKQLLESKIGTCFDQVELERELISRLDVDCRTYFISYPDDDYDMSHVFLIYKDSQKYYWVENAWKKYKGLHIYDSKEDLFDDVLSKFIKTIPDGDFKKVKLYLYERPRYGISYTKFVSNCMSNRSIKIK